LTATLVSSLGAVALCLTLIGLYGVVAFAVAARMREIGIRRAIGAQIGDILYMMFSENIVIVLGGLLLGLIGTLMMTKAIQPLLYGVESVDPASLVFASILVLVLSGIATFVPSWSASRLNPSTVLRYD
jgi:ABC-type antimicrobial peptide transport system permease subunit